MSKIKILMVALLASLWTLSAHAVNDNYALYSFTTGTLQDSIVVRLDTRSGESWFFDGSALQRLRENKTPKRYRNPAYELMPQEGRDGTLLLRLDRVSGQLWVYRQERWQRLNGTPD